jgi:hypothetical protein
VKNDENGNNSQKKRRKWPKALKKTTKFKIKKIAKKKKKKKKKKPPNWAPPSGPRKHSARAGLRNMPNFGAIQIAPGSQKKGGHFGGKIIGFGG